MALPVHSPPLILKLPSLCPYVPNEVGNQDKYQLDAFCLADLQPPSARKPTQHQVFVSVRSAWLVLGWLGVVTYYFFYDIKIVVTYMKLS